MATKFEAVYSAGVLRPLRPLDLSEDTQVTLEMTRPDDGLDHELVARARKRVAQMTRIPTFEEIQDMLSDDPGSWAEAIIRERSDR